MHRPIAYTDGSCLGNPGPGGWGVRVLYPDDTVQEFGAAAGHTTNNRMELHAAIAALEKLRDYQQVTIATDSRYVIDGLTRWLPNWRRRDWVTASGTPVKNREVWQRLAQLNHAGVRWRHVRGHSGDPNNERVDDIARAFASGARPQLFRGRVGAQDDPVTTRACQTQPVSNTAGLPHRPGKTLDTPQYISIVGGVVAIDGDWSLCAARVRGVSGARYKKVRTSQELAAFCAEHGVELPLSC